MDEGSISSTKSGKSRKTTTSTSSTLRPRPTQGRVIGLPSTTSTGLWAAHDDFNVVENIALKRNQPPPTDLGYINNTELTVIQNLNEQLQQQIATLELQKNDAFVQKAEAEGKVLTLQSEIQRISNDHHNREDKLLNEIKELKERIDQQSGMLSDWPRRVATAEASLEIERSEVQRAVTHARNAGLAADNAIEQLQIEQNKCKQYEQQLNMKKQHDSESLKDIINNAIKEKTIELEKKIEEISNQCNEYEDDFETEKEWREAAQKERNESIDRYNELQKYVEKIELQKSEISNEKSDLYNKLQEMDQECKNAEILKEENDLKRKERIRKKIRDQQSSAYYAKENDRSKILSLENKINKLETQVEDFPRIQSSLRQEKKSNAMLHSQIRELISRLSKLGGDISLHVPTPQISKQSSKQTQNSHGGSSGNGNGSKVKSPRPVSPVQVSPPSKQQVKNQNHQHIIKKTSPIQTKGTLKKGNNSQTQRTNTSHNTEVERKAGGGGFKKQPPYPPEDLNQSLIKKHSSKTMSQKTNHNFDDFDDFDNDDDDENDSFYPKNQNQTLYQRNNYDDDINDDDGLNSYGDEDDDKRLFSEGVRGPRHHILASRASQQQYQENYQEEDEVATRPVQVREDAAAMPGSDAPDWLRD
mmetsp:Transcript_7318/g.8700  ORF Transcript_7318/g.8700 Transcript_7318/m.8700 type:complete len:645 (-) Transcript_7318:120-2054(-)